MKIRISQRTGAWIAVASLAFVTVSPVIVSAATDTEETTISATVDATISVTTSTTVSIALTPTGGGVVSSSNDTVSVSTNNSGGYNLTVEDSDADTDLVNGANTFAASAGTKTVPIALANDTWGVAVASGTTGIGTNGFDASYTPAESNNASSTSLWAGMPASGAPMLLKSTTTVASNDTTSVWYAVKATTAQPAGTYTDTVTYTATTN